MSYLLRIWVLALLVLTCADGYSQTPHRIVSLAPSLTKMLYLLGAQHELVGCTSFCEEALKDKKCPVASAIEVNLEKLYLLKPDLVISSSLTKPATIAAIEKFGIKVMQFPMPKSYKGICSQFIEIAELTGKKNLASKIVEQQQLRLNLLRQSMPKGKKPKVFFEIGANPLFSVIPNTFMDDYISFSGGENIASELKTGSVGREYVLLKNPDFIFISSMGMLGKEEKSIWEGNPNISASKNGKIYLIDSDKACSPNPVNFVDIVEQLMALMYP
jgi:ABC-type Fe3+-hydroxamate transport system substrate-binding protein